MVFLWKSLVSSCAVQLKHCIVSDLFEASGGGGGCSSLENFTWKTDLQFYVYPNNPNILAFSHLELWFRS